MGVGGSREREGTELAPEGLGSGTWWDVRLSPAFVRGVEEGCKACGADECGERREWQRGG